MPITRRSESNLVPFFHLALGRAEAKREQQITSNQFGFEEQAAIAQALRDFSSDQKDSVVSAAGGVGAIGGKVFDAYTSGGLGGGGGGGLGGGGGGGGLTSLPLGGGGGGGGSPAGGTERLSSIIAKDRDFGSKGVGGTLAKTSDPLISGNVDLNTQGGRTFFGAATRANAATIAQQRKEENARVSQQRDFQMKALASGALSDFAKPGFSQTQKENLASLQTARNVVTGGTTGDGGFRLSPGQQRQALQVIDERMQNILSAPGMIPLTRQEIAERKVPTTADVVGQNVVKGAVEYGLDRNGAPKVLVDNTQERFKIMEMARDMLTGSKLSDGRMYDDLPLEERTAIMKAQFEVLWGINADEDPSQPDADVAGGGDPSQVPTGLEGGPQGPPQIEPFPDTRAPGFDPNQLEVGAVYEAVGPDGKTIIGVWTGSTLDTNLERGVREAQAHLNKILGSVN